MTFAVAKFKRRQLQVAREGCLHSDEDPEGELLLEAGADVAKMAKAVAARKRAKIKNILDEESSGMLPTREMLRGKCAFLEDGALAPQLGRLFLLRTLQVSEADVMITSKPADLCAHSPVVWAAILRGAYVLSPAALASVPAGVCVKYVAAMATQRRLYMSAPFRERHERIANIIVKCMDDPLCKWRHVPTLAEYMQLRPRCRGPALLGLVTRREMGEEPFFGCKHAYEGPGLLQFLAKIDAAASRYGVEARASAGSA